ncbi:MAG: hypothetical protein JXR48_17965 [Candidatus Delongbacteria bacterium]|nr:hypothetical protein [Candidatus Delongbacteria bacterium]MBN2836846.1 hypothetical protein [Candidatus Delongbacteria bacterium]
MKIFFSLIIIFSLYSYSSASEIEFGTLFSKRYYVYNKGGFVSFSKVNRCDNMDLSISSDFSIYDESWISEEYSQDVYKWKARNVNSLSLIHRFSNQLVPFNFFEINGNINFFGENKVHERSNYFYDTNLAADIGYVVDYDREFLQKFDMDSIHNQTFAVYVGRENKLKKSMFNIDGNHWIMSSSNIINRLGIEYQVNIIDIIRRSIIVNHSTFLIYEKFVISFDSSIKKNFTKENISYKISINGKVEIKKSFILFVNMTLRQEDLLYRNLSLYNAIGVNYCF